MGRIARGLLIVGAVGLAAFLILRALRRVEGPALAVETMPAPVTVQPITEPVTIQPIDIPTGVILEPTFDTSLSPVPTTTQPAPDTVQVAVLPQPEEQIALTAEATLEATRAFAERLETQFTQFGL